MTTKPYDDLPPLPPDLAWGAVPYRRVVQQMHFYARAAIAAHEAKRQGERVLLFRSTATSMQWIQAVESAERLAGFEYAYAIIERVEKP